MNMKAICVVAACLLTIPAQADWQYTRWGMTVEQVIGASNGAAQLYTDIDKSSENFDALVTAPYTGSGFSFLSVFLFNKSRELIAVKLELLQPGRCGDVLNAMNRSYGSPMYTNKQVKATSYRWRDPVKANALTLRDAGRYCFLRYDPLREVVPSGEL